MADNFTGTGALAPTGTLDYRSTAVGVIHTPHAIAATLESSTPTPISAAAPMPVRSIDQTASGSLTSTTSTTLSALNGANCAVFDLRGTFVATLRFEGTIDGTNFFSLNAQPFPTGALVTSSTAPGAWQCDAAGLVQVRVRCSAFTSGTIVVTIRSSLGSGMFSLDAPLPTGANVIGSLTANQSVNVAQINGTAPTVKAASTPAAATDPALVVSLSQNSIGSVGGVTSNPTSTYTRPADTTPYSVLDLVANNTTAASVAVQSFTATRISAGSGVIPKLVLVSSHTTGLAGVAIKIRLWTTAPTYTNGDNGAYAVATGAAGFLAAFQGTFEQWADGAVAEMTPISGFPEAFKLASGQLIYWDMQALTAFTPQSAKTFVLTAKIQQD